MHVTGVLDVGGVDEVLRLTALKNLREKYALTFVTCEKRQGLVANEIKKLGYPVYGLGMTQRVYDLRIIVKLIQLFRKQKPHIVHLYFKINFLGRIAAKIASVPIIICNEADMDWEKYGLGLGLLAIFKRKLDFLADKIIACSEAVKNYWSPKPNNKYTVIYTPVDLNLFSDIRCVSQNSLFKNNKYPVIGTVSRIHPVKGHQYLIKAMPLILTCFPSVVLKIVGPGPLLNEMKELTKSLGIESKVEFTGPLYGEDLKKALSQMDVFVLPSLTEGLPIAAVEAMAACLPVVASDVGGISEIIKNGNTGLIISPGSSEAIADAITKILIDFEKAKDMSRRGREYILRKFSSSAYSNQLDALYQQLLEKKGIAALV